MRPESPLQVAITRSPSTLFTRRRPSVSSRSALVAAFSRPPLRGDDSVPVVLLVLAVLFAAGEGMVVPAVIAHAKGMSKSGELSPAFRATAACFKRWSYSLGSSCNFHSVAYQASWRGVRSPRRVPLFFPKWTT